MLNIRDNYKVELGTQMAHGLVAAKYELHLAREPNTNVFTSLLLSPEMFLTSTEQITRDG